MEKLVIKLHRNLVLRSVNFWCSRWGERGFTAALAILIGAMTALAAALLHYMVGGLDTLATMVRELTAENSYWLPLFILLPLCGLALSFLIQRLLGGARYAKSLSPLILALHRKRTSIPLSETFTHMLSSAFSVGLGGSAGLEAPSVLTGAAIGANTGSFFYVVKKRRTLLLGCGAAAGISAIFDSPIAGVLFAAEVLLPEFSVSALIPMLLSSAVAAVLSHLIHGNEKFFLAITAQWRTDAVPCYLLAGICCALVGVYIIRSSYRISALLKKRLRNSWLRLALGGAILCGILYFLPVMRGQGYGFIELLFTGDVETLQADATFLERLPAHPAALWCVLLGVIFLKSVATVLTVDSGGDGGMFAPSMFIGAFTGFAFAKLVNATGLLELQVNNFVVVGMCGVFTAVMRAPLTGIFLIAEVTGGYILLVPLMLVSSISFFAARWLEPYSIYRKALAESNLIVDDRDQSMLSRLTVRTSLNKHFKVLHPSDPLNALVARVQEAPGNGVFPVLDDDGRLLGLVYLERVMTAVLNKADFDFLLVYDFMDSPAEVLGPDDDLARAMAAFDVSKLNTLPVCSPDGLFMGFLDKTPIFSKYRGLVKEADNY